MTDVLDHPLWVTTFADLQANSLTSQLLSLNQFADLLAASRNTGATSTTWTRCNR